MNGIVQKVVCFFALLLVMSIGSVAHAQQQSYYVYEHTYSESAKSKTVAAVQQHDLLVLQNGKLAYEYDMLRINKDGINEQKQLPRGVAEIVTYSENAYVVFYNEKAQQLEVYDENLQLIDTEQVTMSSKTNAINVYTHEAYVRFVANVYDEDGQWRTEDFVYSLEQEALVTDNIVTPLVAHQEDYTDNGETLLVQFYDALGYAKEAVALNPIMKQLGLSSNMYYTDFHNVTYNDDRFTFLIFKNNGFNSVPQFITMSYDGQLLHVAPLNATDWTNIYPLNASVSKVIDPSNETLYTYRPQSSQLLVEPMNVNEPTKQFSPINDQLYAQYIEEGNESNSYTVHVKNNKDELQYTLTNIQYISNSNDYYMIAVQYDEQQQRVVNVVYDAATGMMKMKLPLDSIYNEWLNDHLLYVETIRTEDDRVTGVLYDLQQLNTYTSDKKWTVTFTDEVDDNSVTDETIYVLNAQGKRELVTTDVNGNELFVYAPSGGYAVGDYTLYVDGVQSTSAVTLKERATKSFTVKK